MGFLGDMGNAEVQDKLRAGAQACKRLGKPCGIVGANPEVVASFLEYGFSWVAVGSDLAMLASRATEYLGAVRTTLAKAASKA
jgi:2-keto-3-deoxy-L-rhamnonate aldolase RhmA